MGRPDRTRRRFEQAKSAPSDTTTARNLRMFVSRDPGNWLVTAAVCGALSFGISALYLADLHYLGIAGLVALATWAYLSRPATSRGLAFRRSLAAAAALIGIGSFTSRIVSVLLDPGAWDFLCFFLDGKVITAGLDPYSPESYRKIFPTLQIPVDADPGFIQGVVNVGFKYPPPTLLLVAPFGLLDFQVGLTIWVLLIVALPGLLCACLVRRELGHSSSRPGAWLFAITLVTLSPGGSQTVMNQQTLFACLCVLLLMTHLDKRILAGVVAGVGIIFKTLLIIGPLYLLVSGRYRAFVASCFTLAFLIGLVYLIVGPGPLLAYLGADWVSRVPLFEFSQDINQSLLGVTIRTADDDADVHPLKRGDFLISSALIAGITFLAVVRARISRQPYFILGLAVTSALLVYPGTLRSYGLLLLIPLLALLAVACGHAMRSAASGAGERKIARPPVVIAALVGAFFGLEYISLFAATVLVWTVLVTLVFLPEHLAGVRRGQGN